MWGSRDRQGRKEVTCIACGTDVPRSSAREYDKEGDRFDRRDKQFEYLCKGCYRELCHQPRRELEALLVEAGAGEGSNATFLEAYTRLATEGSQARNERRER